MSLKDVGKAQSQPGAEERAALVGIIEAWKSTMHWSVYPSGNSYTDGKQAEARQAFSRALTQGKELLERGGKS